MEHINPSELTWQEYESVTKYIYQTLGAQYGIKVVGYGNDFKVSGKSGVKHQIDVLTVQPGEDKLFFSAIECKLLNKKVTKDTVMKLHSIMLDCEIESGIIVSKMGFTKDTLTYAGHLGIKLVQLRELNSDENQREIVLGNIEICNQVLIKRPKITCIDFGSLQIYDEQKIIAMHFKDYAVIRTVKGRDIPFYRYVSDFCDELHNCGAFLKTISKDYEPIEGNLIRKYTDEEYNIEKITFSGFLCEIDAGSSKSFELVDQVWMVMKEIFEKKGYRLTTSGFLFEDVN
jgi:Restriction endonuclease